MASNSYMIDVFSHLLLHTCVVKHVSISIPNDDSDCAAKLHNIAEQAPLASLRKLSALAIRAACGGGGRGGSTEGGRDFTSLGLPPLLLSMVTFENIADELYEMWYGELYKNNEDVV